MDKKRIKESLIKALVMMLVQIIYIKLFGKVNMLVGIIMAMGAISFLMRDLTNALLYRSITFLILNLILGVSSYISLTNVYIGLVVNFLVLFITTYVYMNDFRVPTSYIFLMLYIFMWSIPINLTQLPTRLLSLCFGVILIILGQIIFNKNRFENNTNKIIKDIVNDIVKEIEDIQENKFDKNQNMNINKKIKNLLTIINGRSHISIYHSKYEITQFNIAVYLDRLNLIINHVVKYDKDKEIKNIYLEEIKNQIINIRLFSENKKDIKVINKEIELFIEKYEKVINKPLFLSESIYLLKIFKLNINNNEESKDKNLNKIYKTINVSDEFSLLNNIKENFNFNSLRLIYSLKLSIAISLTMFLVQSFDIEYGKWIVITIYVIIQPYEEDTIIKAKQRFNGTFIGAILFVLIFSFIHDIIPKTIILGIAFFYYFYVKEYYKTVISMTIISLSSISLVENIDILSINRIIFISIGIGIGLIFNKYFLPYNIADSMNELKNKYKQNNKLIQKQLDKVIKGKGDLDKLIKLSLLQNQIENKLIINNDRVEDKEIDKLIYKHSIIMSDARFLLLKLYHENYK